MNNRPDRVKLGADGAHTKAHSKGSSPEALRARKIYHAAGAMRASRHRKARTILRHKLHGPGEWKSRRHEGHDAKNNLPSPLSTRSILILGALALMLILLSLGNWFTKQARGSVAGKPATSNPQSLAIHWESPGKEQAVELVRQAMIWRDPSTADQWFHIRPGQSQLILESIERISAEMGADPKFTWVGDIGHGEQPLTGVLISTRHRSSRMRLAILTPDEQGVWKLDFDALACTSSPAWDVILDTSRTMATVRAVFKPDSYYNGRFTERDWSCYRLSSPNSEQVIFGYCRRLSAQDLALNRILDRNRLDAKQKQKGDYPGHRGILKLIREGDDLGNQFEITRVLAPDWILTEQIYDERFSGLANRNKP